MNRKISTALVKVLACLLFVFLFTGYLLPITTNNYSDEGFGGDGEGAASGTSSSSLKYHIAEGGGHFLESYSHALLFMQKMELSETRGFNQAEFKDLVSRALESMTQAHAHYVSLKQAADLTPYNMTINAVLKSFDYDAFQEEHGLRTDMFAVVKKYLKQGNIRGIYGETITRTAALLEILANLKAQVDAGMFPKIPDVWKLNQAYTDAFLIGQYVAQVFAEVLEL
jgi:hypothetical protein